jgi:TorA maturation chaperone TorD
MTSVLANDAARGDGQAAGIPAEDLLRADIYALLATLLRSEPENDFLDSLAAAESDETEFGQAVGELAAAATAHSREAIDQEFHDLFIGVGQSEMKPYTSFYLTGFMYEKPLAKLRVALEDLGIAKSDDTVEPEDHIASLCETMCALILGKFGAPIDVVGQKVFFDTHIGPWAALFFGDLQEAESASFYRSVGTLGKLFMHIESQAFEMAA